MATDIALYTPVDGLRPLHGFNIMGVLLKAGVRHTAVPDEFWAKVKEDRELAVVSCMCGASPRVELAAAPVKCGCQRWFFYDGTRVWSLNAPTGEPT